MSDRGGGLLERARESSLPHQSGASYEMSSLMRNTHISRQLADLLARSRYEVLPTNNIEHAVLESVPKDVRLTVTASNGT